MKYKHILIKISGEALARSSETEGTRTSIDYNCLVRVARDIKKIRDLGVHVSIVIGGGNIYRGLQGVAQHGMNRPTADHMGMLATAINGLALSHALEQQDLNIRLMSAFPIQTIMEHYDRSRALRHLGQGCILIFVGGTGNPYFTTDTAAVLRALEMNCDVLMKATKVKGVYTKDPALFDDAEFIETLTYDEVIKNRYGIMDQTAFTMLQANRLPLIVFSLYEENAMLRAALGEKEGTLIV